MMDSIECLRELERILAAAGTSKFWRAVKQIRSRRIEVVDRPERIRLSPTKKTRLFMEQNGLCNICGESIRPREPWHIDHKNPNLTGSDFNAWTNLAITHASCNTSKGGRSIAQQSKRTGKQFTEVI